jgi:ankyrin repeat protein
MPHSHRAPTRTLPEQPSLVQLKKQAKDLLRAYRAADPAAVAEVARFEQHPNLARFALADAQRVLARAYGFLSWTKLKEHVDGIHVQAFCEAVEAGDVSAVRKFAKARPDLVNSERGAGFGESIGLHFAVLNRNAEMTRVLMELGSDARKGIWPHRSATGALTIAGDRGYDEIVAIIQQEEARRRQQMSMAGATVGSKTYEIFDAILKDRTEEAIQILETDLSLVGACNLRGATPLHAAAWAHNVPMIAWLLERQANVHARDAEGKTPLDYAAIVAGWSAHGRHFCYLENSHKGPAVFDETVGRLRAGGAELTLRVAVATGDQETVRQMHRDGKLRNEIHTLRGGLLSIAVRVNRPNMVALLLDLGLDPDESVLAEDGTHSSWGMPLWFCAMCGRHEIAKLLLARGADVNAIVFASGDALSIAGDTRDDSMETLLRRHGARITVEGVAGAKDRKTARAILDGTIPAQSLNVDDPTLTDLAEQMLWAAGGNDPEIVRMCLPHMVRKPDDPWWNYVLMHATLAESFQAVLDHGIDPDVRGEGGYTMLHHLATDFVPAETRALRATMLLDAGASLRLRDPMLKSTPLGWACRWGRVDLVRLYLSRGADPSEPDAEPWATPSAWATNSGNREVLELLQAR